MLRPPPSLPSSALELVGAHRAGGANAQLLTVRFRRRAGHGVADVGAPAPSRRHRQCRSSSCPRRRYGAPARLSNVPPRARALDAGASGHVALRAPGEAGCGNSGRRDCPRSTTSTRAPRGGISRGSPTCPRSRGMRRIALAMLVVLALATLTGILNVTQDWNGLPLRARRLRAAGHDLPAVRAEPAGRDLARAHLGPRARLHRQPRGRPGERPAAPGPRCCSRSRARSRC